MADWLGADMGDSIPIHITPGIGGYVRGCRCEGCRSAKSDDNRRYRESQKGRANRRGQDRRAYEAAYRARPEVQERNRRYQREYHVLNYEKKRETQRWYHIGVKYGLTREQYETMVGEQDGKCAICCETPEVLVVDHDHRTGEVRGLLCNGCNTALGHLQDNADRADRAAAYLRERGA